MTVSPPASNSPRPPQAESSTVSPDSVGWLFIQKYYEVYTKNLSTLYKVYDRNASINHDKFPEPSGTSSTPKVMYQAKGIEAIKTLFKNADSDEKAKGKNRIVITSADFQTSLDKNILIVVFGEWAKGDSAYWQFSQTFLLSPSKENVYDVGNDILKFTEAGKYNPDHVNNVTSNEKGTKNDAPASAAAPAPAAPQPSSNARPTETKVAPSTPAVAPAPSTAAPEPTKESKPEEPATSKVSNPSSESTPANADKKATPSVATTEEPLKQTSKSQDEAASESKPNKTTDPEAAPEQPKSNVPLSWADLAAKEPPKSASSKIATVASPGAAKVAPAPLPVVKKSTPPQNRTSPLPSPATTTATTANSKSVGGGKYKKEEWYPIYIRNVEVKDDELKNALLSNFGDIKFYKRNEKVALIDFQTKEGQEAALKAKTLQINDNIISLQPRESKNANGKPDFKRGRNEKKQNVKKNNRSSSRS